MSFAKLEVTGLSGVVPSGCSITYSIGAIPTATLDLAPKPTKNKHLIDESPEEGSILHDLDKAKRTNDINIYIVVQAETASGNEEMRHISFDGKLDGISISNSVGGNTYQAVIKNKTQVLLELTTTTPGLYPAGVDIYKCSDYSLVKTLTDNRPYQSWLKILKELKLPEGSPVEYYTKALTLLLEKQKNGWQEFLGTSKMIDGTPPFKKIFEDPRYKKAVSLGAELMAKVDYSAINSGYVSTALNQGTIVSEDVRDCFIRGSNIVLENYIGFLANMGCTLTIANSKIFAVPQNSVLSRADKHNTPAKRQSRELWDYNTAYPSNYTAYVYNDNGFRDIGSVVLTSSTHRAGSQNYSLGFDAGIVSYYIEDEGLSQASGIYTIPSHPWMLSSPSIPLPADNKKASTKLDSPGTSMVNDVKKHDQSASEQRKASSAVMENKKQAYKDSLLIAPNYAKTKFYQARYSDRHGSVTLHFDPNWVPGTGGTLYIRATNMFLDFYVTSVTHNISMHAPCSGTATTVVSFCCARMGTDPPGVASDEFLGYNMTTEEDIQQKFVKDITGA